MKLKSQEPVRDQLNFETLIPATPPGRAPSPPENAAREAAASGGEEELIALAEHLQSGKLSAPAAARGYLRLTQEPYNLTPPQIARALGQEPAVVRKYLALCYLPPLLQSLLEENKLSFGHLEALQRLRRADDQECLARRLIDERWDAETTENEVNRFLGEREKSEAIKDRAHLDRLLAAPIAERAEHSESDVDPLLPVWATLRDEFSLQAAAQWQVAYRGALRWTIDVKPRTADPGASRLRLAEWFRKMADALEGRRR